MKEVSREMDPSTVHKLFPVFRCPFDLFSTVVYSVSLFCPLSAVIASNKKMRNNLNNAGVGV